MRKSPSSYAACRPKTQQSILPLFKSGHWRGSLKPEDELRVIFGGHWSENPGWLILDKCDQDIGQTLKFSSNTVDVIFTEHVYEHLEFVAAVGFLKESLRVLKPGGIFRVVCPMLDSILAADFSSMDNNIKTYIKNSLVPYFVNEHALLEELLDGGGISHAPFEFFLNSMFREHGHRFIWSEGLLIRVMCALGFDAPTKMAIGEGSRSDYCIERRRRGIYLGEDWREELFASESFDVESTVVEARKPIAR